MTALYTRWSFNFQVVGWGILGFVCHRSRELILNGQAQRNLLDSYRRLLTTRADVQEFLAFCLFSFSLRTLSKKHRRTEGAHVQVCVTRQINNCISKKQQPKYLDCIVDSPVLSVTPSCHSLRLPRKDGDLPEKNEITFKLLLGRSIPKPNPITDATLKCKLGSFLNSFYTLRN